MIRGILALLGMFIAAAVLIPVHADDLPTVYRGPGSPRVEFESPNTVRILPGSSVIEITGSFSPALLASFIATLANAPQIGTIWLESPGGLIQPAMEIARIIQARGLDTYIERFCASACTLAFLGGHQRFLAADARLGFHQAHAPNQPPERSDPVLRRAYSRSGVPASFIDHVLRTPPEALWFPTVNELHDAGIVTGQPPRELSLQDDRSPASWQEAIKQLRWASNDTLLQFALVWSDLLDQLQHVDPNTCWDYLHHVPVDLGAHVRRETLDAVNSALQHVRDDVRHAPAVGIAEAEKTRVLDALVSTLPAPTQSATVAALRPDGDHAALCPVLRLLLRTAITLPQADRGAALRAILADR